MTINLKAIDISHHNEGLGPGPRPWPIEAPAFQLLKDFGLVGVILKGTQGIRGGDVTYAARRDAARSVGLLTGAYDFNTGDPAKDQVDFFFDYVKPDDQTLCCLDFEDNKSSEMSLEMAREYLELADARLGRKFWIYSGNRIKQMIVDADDETRAFFAAHPLWGCQYGPVWKNLDVNHKPLPWDKPTLWQFSGDGTNNHGITVPGILQGNTVDMNHFDGSDEELAAVWVA